MTTDGGLTKIFERHLPSFHWQTVETFSTGRGVPDLNYCELGIEGWIENKKTDSWRVRIDPEQVGWIERRRRHGGRVFVAVRRRTEAGPRKGEATESLLLFSGDVIRALKDRSLREVPPLLICQGSPLRWEWEKIRGILRGP